MLSWKQGERKENSNIWSKIKSKESIFSNNNHRPWLEDLRRRAAIVFRGLPQVEEPDSAAA